MSSQAPLPDSWDDEPWPLDDPIPAPSLNPTNWSDTHDDPPQVADLADEAWQYAVDHGCSMEQALATLQGRVMPNRGWIRFQVDTSELDHAIARANAQLPAREDAFVRQTLDTWPDPETLP